MPSSGFPSARPQKCGRQRLLYAREHRHDAEFAAALGPGETGIALDADVCGVNGLQTLCHAAWTRASGVVQATWMYRAAKASYDEPLNAEQYFKDMQVSPPLCALPALPAALTSARAPMAGSSSRPALPPPSRRLCVLCSVLLRTFRILLVALQLPHAHRLPFSTAAALLPCPGSHVGMLLHRTALRIVVVESSGLKPVYRRVEGPAKQLEMLLVLRLATSCSSYACSCATDVLLSRVQACYLRVEVRSQHSSTATRMKG